MNLTNLVAAVQARGYTFSQTATDPTNPIFQALNAAYRTVCGAQRWPFLEKHDESITTTAGQTQYALSSIADLRQLDAVRLQDTQGEYDLENMEPQELKALNARYQPDPDLPRYWSQYAGELMLWPAPDGPYTLLIDYIYTPPDLAAGGDVPVLPTTYHDILVWATVMDMAYRERDWLGLELAQGNYEEQYRRMEEEYLLRQRQTSSTVKRSGWWGEDDLCRP